MIFHRSLWSEPTPHEPKFADYVRRPKEHLLSKFTGIGNEVATFLANHVLCLDVGDRVTARDFGKWVKNLPEMIAGKAAVRDLRTVAKDARLGDKGMFAKNPIGGSQARKIKPSTSALTSTAPVTSPGSFQGLSSMPPPSQLAQSYLTAPELARDVPSASTDEQTTPAEPGDLASPDSSEIASPSETNHDAQTDEHDQDPSRPTSTQQKRRKRGVRKGKAAQAALAAEKSQPTQPEREALLSELAQASQSLARDLSKSNRGSHVDTTSSEQFPPLGTSPAQLAQAKRSKWRDMLSFSSTSDNPELAALARRVAERESGGVSGKGGFGNWSAPAKMQDDHRVQLAGTGRPGFKQTNTMSTSGVTSQLSSFGGVPAMSSATSSGIEEEQEPEETKSVAVTPPEEVPEKESKETEDARQKKAVQAAAALSESLGAMGSFHRPQHVPRHGPLHGRNIARSPPTGSAAVPIVAQPPPQTYRPHKPAFVPAPAPAVHTARSPPPPAAILSPASPASAAVKSSVTKTTVGSTTTATSLDATVTAASASVSTLTPSTVPPAPESIPQERQGKIKGQMQFLNKFMQGVKLSNRKD